MSEPVLHYVCDPLCGWCYAAEPLVRTARDSGVRIVLHGGELWQAPLRPDAATRQYLRQNDTRIAALTGQTFGNAYLEGLLHDPATTFWSEPTIAAMIAAASVQPGSGLDMLAAIQNAHYISGQRVVEEPVLGEVAASIGLKADAFRTAFKEAPVRQHLMDTKRFMQNFGLRGYPGFVLERNERSKVIEHQPHYGHPEAFVAELWDC